MEWNVTHHHWLQQEIGKERWSKRKINLWLEPYFSSFDVINKNLFDNFIEAIACVVNLNEIFFSPLEMHEAVHKIGIIG